MQPALKNTRQQSIPSVDTALNDVPVRSEAHVTVKHPPIDLWPFVADANRMDRSVGLPEATFTRTPRPEGGETVVGEYRRYGVLLARWNEYPFEWQRPKRYSVVREYDVGPIRRFFGGIELTEKQDGTVVRVFAEFYPRSRIVRPWLKHWLAPRVMRRARQQYKDIETFLDGRSLDPFPAIGADPRLVRSEQIDACALRMQSIDAPAEPTGHLKRLVTESGDEDVAGMRPLALAQLWGTDPVETVKTFLQATVAGLLEMRWEFVCPSCRGVKANAARLRDLEVTGYCVACNLPFAANVDEGIEARFYPTETVRDLRIGTYCIGSPMNTPHRIAQTTLKPGEARIWQLDLEPGPYVVRSPQSKNVTRLLVDADSEDRATRVEVYADKMDPALCTFASGPVEIEFVNTLEHETTIAIDDAIWSDTATTPSRIMTVPGYHTLFSGDALAPGIELAVGRVGILFSDLAGSTAMYERAGEARAFRLVTEHFEVLRRAIEQSGGAVVKTIGDAVMGVFPNGVATFEAALEAQRQIRSFDTQGLADSETLLKIGVHAGPAYLVTLNDRLDYFGTTVNIAARAQHEASGGEIVCTNDVLIDSEELLDRWKPKVTPFSVRLNGLNDPVLLHRIRALIEPVSPTITGMHERENVS